MVIRMRHRMLLWDHFSNSFQRSSGLHWIMQVISHMRISGRGIWNIWAISNFPRRVLRAFLSICTCSVMYSLKELLRKGRLPKDISSQSTSFMVILKACTLPNLLASRFTDISDLLCDFRYERSKVRPLRIHTEISEPYRLRYFHYPHMPPTEYFLPENTLFSSTAR